MVMVCLLAAAREKWGPPPHAIRLKVSSSLREDCSMSRTVRNLACGVPLLLGGGYRLQLLGSPFKLLGDLTFEGACASKEGLPFNAHA